VNEVDKIKGGMVLAKYIQYTIQPTDSVAGVAKRFGVDLHELVKLNPQVCTTGPQEGIEIKIPVDHLELVSDVLPEIESDESGLQEERIAGFKLKLPNGELYQFE
jgi:LysM repeat protein